MKPLSSVPAIPVGTLAAALVLLALPCMGIAADGNPNISELITAGGDQVKEGGKAGVKVVQYICGAGALIGLGWAIWGATAQKGGMGHVIGGIVSLVIAIVGFMAANKISVSFFGA